MAGPCFILAVCIRAMQKETVARRRAVSALIDAENGHGLGQGIDRFLMLARVVQGLSVRLNCFTSASCSALRRGPAARASSIFFMSMGRWKAGRCRKEQGGQQQHGLIFRISMWGSRQA